MRIMTGIKWSMLPWMDVPAVVSLPAAQRHRIPRARNLVGIDSGGAYELANFGRWRMDANTFARRMRFAARSLGYEKVLWCAIQDWMCEPEVLKNTGFDVEEHQRRTIQSYVDLVALDPILPWMPVVQGWALDDYMRCVDMYAAAGIDLTEFERVGVGSVCSRQSGKEAALIIVALIRRGIRVHAYGVKLEGLLLLLDMLTEWEWEHMLDADSAAWSDHARRAHVLMDGHFHGHKTPDCRNCWKYALVRRQEMLASINARRTRRAAA